MGSGLEEIEQNDHWLFDLNPDAVYLRREATSTNFGDELPLPEQIRRILAVGPKTLAELHDRLRGIKLNTLDQKLRRMPDTIVIGQQSRTNIWALRETFREASPTN